MAKYLNDYEGGANGEAVTVANSGGGSRTAFTAVAPDIAYTNARAAGGSLSAVSTAAVGVIAQVRQVIPGLPTTLTTRLYYWLGSTTTDDHYIIRVSEDPDVIVATVRIVSTGVLRLMGEGGATLWTSTQQFPVGQWVRVEVYLNSATNQYRLAMFSGHSTTPIADSGLQSGAVGTGTAYTQVRHGKIVASAGYAGVLGWDEYAVHTGADATSALIGPVAPSNVPPTVSAGPDQTGVEPWSTVTLSFSATDSDGTIASYAVTQTAGVPVTLTGTGNSRTYNAPATIAGDTQTFSVTATDDDGAVSAPDTVSVAVLLVTQRAVIGGVEVPMRVMAVTGSGTPSSGIYLPTATTLSGWAAHVAEADAGTRQAHIAVVGDSIAFGAASTGSSSPKYANSWPGRLRTLLAAQYGNAGTGIVIADAQIRANPAWDPRWTYTGAVTDHGFGFHKAAAFRLDAVVGTHLELTAACDKFVVYNLPASGGVNTATVDGGAAGTFRNVAGGTAPTIAADSSYHQFVTEIPAGTSGTHTLRIVPSTASDTHDAFIAAVEARNSAGMIRVSNPSINGKSLNSLFAGSSNNDETTGLFGLPLIDMLRADLLIVALGTNDWQAATPAATIKTWLTTLVQRQHATGPATGGGQRAGGEVLLLWNPQPDIAALGESEPLWEEYRQVFLEVADEQDCALLDLGERWGTYAEANADGMFADTIHPSDAGAMDLAQVVHDAVLEAAYR